jgi:hypothetical protein
LQAPPGFEPDGSPRSQVHEGQVFQEVWIVQQVTRGAGDERRLVCLGCMGLQLAQQSALL